MNQLLVDYVQGRISTNIPMTGTTQGGRMNLTLEYDDDILSSDDDGEGVEEAKQYVQRQMDYYSSKQEQARVGLGGLTDIVDGDDETVVESEFLNELSLPAVFSKYPFDVYCKRPLPIDDFREKILDLINTNQVVIVQGPTGCGKTTQVPQYVIDECKEKNLPCNIVVTQPRRIAAINIANRVCEERGWAMETVCGYQVGLEKRVSEDVILTYVTTEVLLQKLISERNLNKYTHIIIDEVHERNKTLDFLLLIVRKYLFTNSQKVKVVLMSATLEAEQFAYYFRSLPRNLHSDYIPAPILKVNKKGEFVTNIHYIEKMSFIGGTEIPRFDINEPCIDPIQLEKCLALLNLFDKIDEVDAVTGEVRVGSVLIFLPGFHEIEEVHNLLDAKGGRSAKYLWEIIPLHSSLPTEQMRLAFKVPTVGYRKIILSTNIAESSVTVADVTYVIDFCLTKQVSVNQISKFSTLSLEWASHNNCDQRAGRVGRVANGRVYRLVTSQFYKHEMSSNAVPEMQRAPLENIILYLKLLEIHDTPKNVLQLAISPPNLKDVESCVWHLKEVGALLMTCKGEESVNDGDLTFMGRVMGSLPIDVHLSKLIMLGQMFSCLRETVIMAAGATVTNLFNRPFQERLECYRKKLALADHSCSDFFSILNLYKVWFQKKTEGSFKNEKDEYAWCRTYYVSFKSIREMKILIDEIEKRLRQFRIEQVPGPGGIFLTAVELPTVLKVAICGAFYPNYFIRSSDYGQIDTREAFKQLNGRDPYNTVYLGNMAPNQPCQIYVRQIKKIMGAGQNVNVSFDGDSSKIFVEYKSSKHPEPVVVDGRQCVSVEYGRIAEEVYVAIRKRQLKMKFKLNILPEMQARRFAKDAEKYQKSIMAVEDVNCFSKVTTSILPPLDIEYISVILTHIVDAGYFYCQNVDEETAQHLQRLGKLLNGPSVFLKYAEGELELDGKLYAARFVDDNLFYRCKVVHLYPDTKGLMQVMFVDYGNVQKVRRRELFDLPPSDDPSLSCPPLAMCCALSEVKPAMSVGGQSGLWSPIATKALIDSTRGVVRHAKVYSVVNDIVHLELYMSNPNQSSQHSTSFNQWLIKNHHAQPAQESFMSKSDHELRVEVLRSENPNSSAALIAAAKLCRYTDFDAPKMTDGDFTEIQLTGPFSPLEMKVCGLVSATSQVTIRVDEDSVNGVLLDEFPEDHHGRLLVAGLVAQSPTSNTLKISQTTMMPNIPGLPALMTLLFCPAMEPKITMDGTRVGGILCGLGFNRHTKRAFYPNHDIAMVLDTELNIEFIREINALKCAMNRAVKLMNNIYDEVSYLNELLEVQKTIKTQLFNLLYKRQTDAEKEPIRNLDKWDSFDHNVEILKMKEGAFSEDDIFRVLWFVRIPDEQQSQIMLNKNLNDLYKYAKGLETAIPCTCMLCQSQVLYNADAVRVHLFSDGHRKKFTAFKEQNQVA